MQLTQKEKMLLNDEKSLEEICINKYQASAAQAKDPQLKQLFNNLAAQEQHHYNMIDQMLQGQQPAMNQNQQQSGQSQQSAQSQQSGTGQQSFMNNMQQNKQQYGQAQQSYQNLQSAMSAGAQNRQQSGQTAASGTAASQQNNQQGTQSAMSNAAGMQAQNAQQNDKMLCSDLLATEKYVSGTYDTGIFEASNAAIRQALQHIQKEEQQHGEQIFNYMNSHGMYNVQ
jgi:rubrerythrin